MIEFLRHALGLCGEPHPSLLTALASMPFIGYWFVILKNKFKNDPKPDLEIDEAHKKHLKELGLWEEDSYDGSEYISKL